MGPYVIEFGDLWFVRTLSGPGGKPKEIGKVHVCGPHDRVAVVYDAEDGTLHKHGTEENAVAWLETTRAKLRDNGFESLAENLTMVAFNPVPEAIAELNACIATSGRVLGIAERLTAIQEENPAYAQIPRFPS